MPGSVIVNQIMAAVSAPDWDIEGRQSLESCAATDNPNIYTKW